MQVKGNYNKSICDLREHYVNEVIGNLEGNLDKEILGNLKTASKAVLYLFNKLDINPNLINPKEIGNFEKITLMTCLFNEWSKKKQLSSRKIILRELFELIPEYTLSDNLKGSEFDLDTSMPFWLIKHIWPESNGDYAWFKTNKIDKEGVVILPYLTNINESEPKSYRNIQKSIYEKLNVPENSRFYIGACAVPSESLIFVFEDYDPLIFSHEKMHVNYSGLGINKTGSILDEGWTEIKAQKKINGKVDYEYSAYIENINIIRNLIEMNPKLEQYIDKRYEHYSLSNASNLTSELINTVGIKGYIYLYFGTNKIETHDTEEMERMYQKTGFVPIIRLSEMVENNLYDIDEVKKISEAYDTEYITIGDLGDYQIFLDTFKV